jgi:ATP-binding protein involved in chromosome partitioning
MEIDREQVWEKVRQVRDPEFGRSIVERELVDGIDIDEGTVTVHYHLTVPFCPLPFALHIGREIRRLVSEVPGVGKVHVVVQEHLQTEQINGQLAGEA